ncbi:MAG: helix-turn-helix domain-containing protein [Lachnospiraceae bacterium]|nr:helix-turn-helix domain-containing protein [Lachnospiraceae bacterium]
MIWKSLNTDIGNRIRDLRELHHITQEDLAEKLSLSTKHISEVERGLSSFSLDRLIDICELLDTSLDYLVFGKNAAGTEAYIPASVIDVLRSDDEAEKKTLCEYLVLYSKIHR